MHKPKQVINLNVDEWLASFQSAINLHDMRSIHELLHTLPKFKTHDEIKTVLLASMDAEVLICDMRQELVNKRASIASRYFP